MHLVHSTGGGWLRAVLDGRYDVKQVQILNRRDCCSDRIKDAKVYVLDGEKKHQCGAVATGEKGWLTVACPAEAVGNTIEVSTENTGQHLTICGMKVFGVAPTPAATDAGSGNVELNKPLTNNYEVGTNAQATSSAPRFAHTQTLVFTYRLLSIFYPSHLHKFSLSFIQILFEIYYLKSDRLGQRRVRFLSHFLLTRRRGTNWKHKFWPKKKR